MTIKRLHSIVLLGLAMASCNPSSLEDTISLGAGAEPQEASRLDSSGKTIDVAQEEAVVVPQSVTGAYLYCVEQDLAESSEFKVLCALRDDESHKTIDLSDNDINVRWTVDGLQAPWEAKLVSRALPEEPLWHIQHSFEMLDEGEKPLIRQNARFGIDIISGPVQLETDSVVVVRNPLTWSLLDGDVAPPTNTFTGGSEIMEEVILGVCRIYTPRGIIPGKLVHMEYFGRTGSDCYSSSPGDTTRAGTGSSNVAEVLTWPSTQVRDQFSWIDASDGAIPKNAVIGGQSENGRLIYLCRNLQLPIPEAADRPNFPDGEPTPGYIISGESSCRHEFFGDEHLSQTYQVLVDVLAN
ncbi:DM9 repeat-containing protein [Pseudobacteriovorax antillogorgiicola]|uniref:Uncharacterized protein n=1 Tax=Pseudobacteriovorax antillogorgiicola TaxID=1513793 RepID=A0A1Y6BSG0_9BACT|nr:DM9 repeat-containing protein [Pseudobacteriovorax antillogorgiicola]TCS53110.1 uncharacterized protein DUF3421 [Pseudobacteriovorax antillogorgiicola]SMF25625.1 Protein of unknown function [Pseudobacteriovorax antillogorgiicola]